MNSRMDTLPVDYSSNWMLLGDENELTTAICNMDESHKPNVEKKTSKTQKSTYNVITFI